ncbi:MAG: MoxR family ATPase [Symploca sp. SIO2E9]|nr:MoxR family ATPase [Symploca sp. SIO2E9]
MSNWKIFRGDRTAHSVKTWPETPPWRNFNQKQGQKPTFQANDEVINAVNMAIYLRRPLLVTGKPGTGKSSLARAISDELRLEPVLRWPINTRTTLQEGLYYYDAIARLQDSQLKEEKLNIGKYIRLGPLGTAMYPSNQPRVLLIDEIDKSDIDLPNDLLNIFEEGYFEIKELSRLKDNKEYQKVSVQTHDGATREVIEGRITCQEFPIVIMTSNGERDFPLPFKRRCIQLYIKEPQKSELTNIVKAHLGEELTQEIEAQIQDFINKREQGPLATDQLLNVVFMLMGGKDKPKPSEEEKKAIIKRLMAYLNTTGDQ